MARRQRRRQPADQEPGQGRQAGLGHRGHREQDGRLLVHRRSTAATFSQKVTSTPRPARRRSTSCARSIPGCRARSSRPAGGTSAHDRAKIRPSRAWGAEPFSAPWAAARSPPAAAARRAVAARRRHARPRRRAGPGPPFPGAPADPAGLRGTTGSRSRSARRRCRSCRAARPGCGPTAASFPGPTIRRPAGRRTEVTFEHRLPADAGELSVHLHGGHNRSEYDGQPGGPDPSHPLSFYCRDPERPLGAQLRQRPADPPRRTQDATSTT